MGRGRSFVQGYEYQVCSVQYGRVTFVNGAWHGSEPFGGDTNKVLESCPNVWDFLREAGRDGWELVSVVTHAQERQDAVLDMMYLKRPSW